MPAQFASPDAAATYYRNAKPGDVPPLPLLAGYIPPMTKEGPPDQEVHGSVEEPLDCIEAARLDLDRVLIEVSVIPANGIAVGVVGRHGRHFKAGITYANVYRAEYDELLKRVVPDDAWSHCATAHELYLAELTQWVKDGRLDPTGLPLRDLREYEGSPQALSARLRNGGLGGTVRYVRLLKADLPRFDTPEAKARTERTAVADQSTAAVRELMAGLPAALAAAVKAAIDAKGSSK